MATALRERRHSNNPRKYLIALTLLKFLCMKIEQNQLTIPLCKLLSNCYCINQDVQSLDEVRFNEMFK